MADKSSPASPTLPASPTSPTSPIPPTGPSRRPLPSPPTSVSSLVPRVPQSRARRSMLEPVMEGEVARQSGLGTRAPAVETIGADTMQSTPNLGQKRSQFFKDAFHGPDSSPEKNRVLDEAPIIADLKTNVAINDELHFITQFSFQMSTRYSRPLNCIVVTVQHSVGMLFSGSAEPCYLLSIQALPFHVQAATNKRNVALIQRYLEKTLRVSPLRGFVRFMSVPEECFGWNGRTVAGELRDIDHRGTVEDEEQITKGGLVEKLSLRRTRSKVTKQRAGSPTDAVEDSAPSTPAMEPSSAGEVQDEHQETGLRKKKSFIRSFFSKSPVPDGEHTDD